MMIGGAVVVRAAAMHYTWPQIRTHLTAAAAAAAAAIVVTARVRAAMLLVR